MFPDAVDALSWEWYEREKNPWNCSVQLIEGRTGGGYTDQLVFAGFEPPRPSLQTRRGNVGSQVTLKLVQIRAHPSYKLAQLSMML